ncbi:MAG: hypothetical protein JJT82_07260 [Legionellaceae bacterium]|nr:hypothetical protein [Legionellaceae bacterium]
MNRKYPLAKMGSVSSAKQRQSSGAGLAEPGTMVPAAGEPERSSRLQEESRQMEWERRLDEQQGHRAHLRVPVQEAREVSVHEGPEEGYDNQIARHPWLEKQIFDGAHADMIVVPPDDPEARREFDNELRKQHQLRLENQKQNQPGFHPLPRPGG